MKAGVTQGRLSSQLYIGFAAFSLLSPDIKWVTSGALWLLGHSCSGVDYSEPAGHSPFDVWHLMCATPLKNRL